MKSSACPFGPALRRYRETQGLSQWDLAVAVNYHVRNLQRIEAGQHEPGIMLALGLLSVLEVDSGDVFFELMSQIPSPLNVESCDDCVPIATPPALSIQGVNAVMKAVPVPFGTLLKHYRVQLGISQRALANMANYNLRNMAKVEKGEQEPGVMMALRLVCGLGEQNVREFFNILVMYRKSLTVRS